jgi:hypothetical protein
MRFAIALVVLLLVVLGAGCGGSGDASSEIAAALGSSASCSKTPYAIVSRFDGSKAWVYSCTDDGGNAKCMTKQNGIVRDITLEARLVFASSYSGKPDCL